EIGPPTAPVAGSATTVASTDGRTPSQVASTTSTSGIWPGCHADNAWSRTARGRTRVRTSPDFRKDGRHVREFHVASSVTTLAMSNIADLVFDNAASRPDHVALRRNVDGQWQDVTARTFADEVLGLAKGLIASGIEAGDRIAVMSKTRYEWTLADF